MAKEPKDPVRELVELAQAERIESGTDLGASAVRVLKRRPELLRALVQPKPNKQKEQGA